MLLIFSFYNNNLMAILGLMQALRLIRMLEIKKCKLMSTNPTEVEHFNTIKTTERVSIIMRHLCTDPKTIEQIRQSIVKLLIFPLGVLPANALHIQEQSASIVSVICKTGFNSQQVWFLHDTQAITHMVRHLNELTIIDSTTTTGTTGTSSSSDMTPGRSSLSGKYSSQSAAALISASSPDNNTISSTTGSGTGSSNEGDKLLKGLSAEQKGMWIVGMECIVEVISSTLSISSVLLSDFEATGGNKLFVYMLKHSSSERFILLINIIIRLMFDPIKTADEPIISTSAGIIIIDLLKDILHLKHNIKLDQASIDILITISENIYKNKLSLLGKEYMIQNISYSLLTIYSNNSQNCSALEESYNFLSILILTIPAIIKSDSINAILTSLNYICLCIDSCTVLPLTSICAACSVIIQQALIKINNTTDTTTDNDITTTIDNNNNNNSNTTPNTTTNNNNIYTKTEENAILLQLDLIFQTIEGIIKNNSKYSMILINNGFLNLIIYEPFVTICTQVLLGNKINNYLIPIFTKIINILIFLIKNSSEIADECRDIGLTLIIKNLISSTLVSNKFSFILLKLIKELSLIDETHLKDSFNTIFITIQSINNDYIKLNQLNDILSIILLENKNSADLCYIMGGLYYTINSLNLFYEKFLKYMV